MKVRAPVGSTLKDSGDKKQQNNNHKKTARLRVTATQRATQCSDSPQPVLLPPLTHEGAQKCKINNVQRYSSLDVRCSLSCTAN